MSYLKAAILFTSAGLISACSGVETTVEKYLQQDILTASGDILGTVKLKDLGADGTEVTVSVSGLSQEGTHAMHFHEIGLCEAPGFTSSGGHYNPTNMDHGKMSENGPHAGDMMNLDVGSDGAGMLTVVNDRVSIRGDHGLPALLDSDGSALIIHERADDYVTQPTGAAGARIGCAELK
jgi:Cu-Zn family superoxide dismutase